MVALKMRVKQAVKNILFENERNLCGINGSSIPKTINLEWYDANNVGDYLAKVVYEYMLNYYKLDPFKKTNKTLHVSTIGSVLGCFDADTTVWGTGLLSLNQFKQIHDNSSKRKLDIRAVRGPVTRAVLFSAGYKCPENYGDPAIILPNIYDRAVEKEYEVSYIKHESQQMVNGMHNIDTQTKDYEHFIDEIRRSKCVISSSLHGIIIAETYNVPAIFHNAVPYQLYKFLDYYYSTKRYEVVIANTVEEALNVKPMKLPELTDMRNNLISVFPTDMWN